MDSFRGFDDEVAFAPAVEDEPTMEAPPEIGVDERRMHVRAYNYWVSLLNGRSFPAIEDVDPHNIEDFGPHSVLLDFTGGGSDPKIAFLGRALRAECGLDADMKRASAVPSRSLLSRLTDHYLQIIANSAPIGFEAEFVNQRGLNTLYRGILMPLSSDGQAIDFIYGVINWKELVDRRTAFELASAMDRAVAAPAAGECPVWADGPNSESLAEGEEEDVSGDASTLSLWPSDDVEGEPRALDADAGLGDRLCLARESAEAARSSDQRSRAALYRALGDAYDFALAAEAEAQDYAEILEDAGIRAQERAPMTAVAKLVFGADYDKTRLTEFAAALSWGRRQALPQGDLTRYLESFDGGLKGVVQAERRARRPEPASDPAEAARDRLRSLPAIAHAEIESDGGEFVLLIARRVEDGRLAILAPVRQDEALIARAIRKAA
jgi:hypothetical protein